MSPTNLPADGSRFSESDAVRDAMFPTLTTEMIHRVRQYGAEESLIQDSQLYSAGDRGFDFFLVLAGRIDAFECDGGSRDISRMTYGSAQFSGELNLFSDRAALLSARAVAATRVIRIKRKNFRKMVGAESDIGEIILHACMLRRARMIRDAGNNIVLVGCRRSADTLRIQTFMTRNGYPYRFVHACEPDETLPNDTCAWLPTVQPLPVVKLGGTRTLTSPTNLALADALGLSEKLNPQFTYDVAVVGAGPAGLAAAVYAASEGLETVVIEAVAPGGQAGTSSLIENYLGFPTGVSGQQLASRAQVQAQKFGARIAVARTAKSLDCARVPFVLGLDDGSALRARAVVVATGARYRRLNLPELSRFEGQGVHYAATSIEATLCDARDVFVVGGGNSAGQAAVFLSQSARHVHMLVRGDGLASTMSDYLVRRVMSSSNITLHVRSQVLALNGEEYLESIFWRQDDKTRTSVASHLFLMIGADPNTGWLDGCVSVDRAGFIKTGESTEHPTASPFATSKSGVFAVGDVRSSSIKRVASGVGEGSVVVHAIHKWLQQLSMRTEHDCRVARPPV